MPWLTRTSAWLRRVRQRSCAVVAQLESYTGRIFDITYHYVQPHSTLDILFCIDQRTCSRVEHCGVPTSDFSARTAAEPAAYAWDV